MSRKLKIVLIKRRIMQAKNLKAKNSFWKRDKQRWRSQRTNWMLKAKINRLNKSRILQWKNLALKFQLRYPTKISCLYLLLSLLKRVYHKRKEGCYRLIRMMSTSWLNLIQKSKMMGNYCKRRKNKILLTKWLNFLQGFHLGN